MTVDKLELSEEALQIATEKPLRWEYRLFAQVIADEVEKIKNAFQQGYHIKEARLPDSDIPSISLEWLSQKTDEIDEAVKQLTTLINFNFADIFGVFPGMPGMSGGVENIANHSRKVSAFYFRATGWVQIILSAQINQQYKYLQHEIATFGTEVTTYIEQYYQMILKNTRDLKNSRLMTSSPTINIPTERLTKIQEQIQEQAQKAQELHTMFKLLSDTEIVEMARNFIDNQTSGFYTSRDYMIRSDEFKMFFKFLADKNPDVNFYIAYTFTYNVVVEHLSQKWEDEYGEFFLDIGGLSLEEATERFCSIEMIDHEDVVLTGFLFVI